MGYDEPCGTSEEEMQLRGKVYAARLSKSAYVQQGSQADEAYKSVDTTIIDMDVARTKSSAPFFQGGKDYSVVRGSSMFSEPQEALRRVLYTATRLSDHPTPSSENSNNIPVYTQGMNEIVGVLLYAFCCGSCSILARQPKVEADTYWCFKILQSRFLKYQNNMSGSLLPERMLVVQYMRILLRTLAPELYYHLEGIDRIILESCAVRWFTTLFSQSFSIEDSLRIWDFFISFGESCFDATLYIAAAICILRRKTLMSSRQLEVAMMALQSLYDIPVEKIVVEAERLMNKVPFCHLHRLLGEKR